MFLFILFYVLTIAHKMISNIIIFNSILLFVIFAIAWLYPKIDKKMIFFDHPNNFRKIHTKPMPIIGGFIIYIGLFLNIFFFYELLGMNLKISIIFIILFSIFLITGIVDDKKSLSPKTRTIIILLSLLLILPLDKSLVIYNISFKDLDYVILLNQGSLFFTVLCIFFVYNFLNFSDGVNGVAISLTIFYVCFIYIFGNLNFNFFSIIIFFLFLVLFLNLSKKLFIGNNGSGLLAILICVLLIISYNIDQSPKADEIFLVFFLPAIDSLRVVIERIVQKKSPIQPDQNHFHHLLLKTAKENYIFLIYITLSLAPFIMCQFMKTYYSFFLSIIFYLLIIFKLKKI